MTPSPHPSRRAGPFALACTGAAVLGLAGAVASLPAAEPSAVTTFALPSDALLGSHATQRLGVEGADKLAEYTFRNFNGDDLRAITRVAASAVADSLADQGIPERELADLQAWYQSAVAAANAGAAQREVEAVAAADAREEDAVGRANAREREAVGRFNARDETLVGAADSREREAVKRANAKEVTGRITASSQAELEQKMREIEAQNQRAAAELQAEREESSSILGREREANRAQLAQAQAEGAQLLAQDRQQSASRLVADRAQSRQRQGQEAAALEPERERRRVALYAGAGLRLEGQKLTSDVGKIVARNSPRLARAGAALHDLARQKGYSLEDAVGAALAMVQTAVAYKVPPPRTAGKDFLGLLPPPLTLSEGWGDCDTKSALLASLLSSWQAVRMVGISIPEHYLMGVQHIPNPGDVFLEVEGLPYVLLEPAGPGALPPGRVGDHTLAYLKAGGKFGVEPL